MNQGDNASLKTRPAHSWGFLHFISYFSFYMPHNLQFIVSSSPRYNCSWCRVVEKQGHTWQGVLHMRMSSSSSTIMITEYSLRFRSALGSNDHPINTIQYKFPPISMNLGILLRKCQYCQIFILFIYLFRTAKVSTVMSFIDCTAHLPHLG